MHASGTRAIAAQHIHGPAVTGDHAQVTVLSPSDARTAREVDAPPGTGFLPDSATGLFVGRGEELRELREALTARGEAAVTQVRAVHGLGGIGKSTLALHYAHTYRHTYTLVWWITAESPEQIDAALADVAVRLNPRWAAAVPPRQRTAWAMAWLQGHPGWLLVYDNVENPEHLRPYLGSLSGGHHLATSRRATGWHRIAPTIALGTLPEDEATALLCTLALEGRPPTTRQRAEAERLAADLGFLPLALEQAGAYLSQTGTDIAAYRRDLGPMLDRAADGIDPQRTVARVWSMTLHAVRERSPLAVTVLHTLAWFAPDHVPRTLLAPLAEEGADLDAALGVLHAYNMITFIATAEQDDGAGSALSVHRLLQAVLRAQPADTPRTDAPRTDAPGTTSRGTASPGTDTPRTASPGTDTPGTDTPGIGIVAPAGRGDAETVLQHALESNGLQAQAGTARVDSLMPHIIALATTTPPGYHSDLTGRVCQHAADHLHDQAQDARAIPLLETVLAQREQVLGRAHPDTLISRNNLAGAYQAAGDLKRAVPLFETVLPECEQVLGDTHPHTLISRNNLASAYRAAGDLERAVPLYERTLAQREEVFGDMHPRTLASRNNLASAYQAAGDLKRAIPLYETVVAQREQVLGDAHPDTLSSRNNLAGAYQAAGDLERAVPLYERTLAQREEVFGDTHPRTLTSRNNLASAYQEAGDLKRAIPLHESVLAQREKVLGDTHPDTFSSRNNLASAYQDAGDLKRAIPLYESTLAQCEEVLGDTHPDTLSSRNNLAYAYQSMGDLDRAIPLYERTLAQREEVLGDAHPDTLSSRNNLAVAYQGQEARSVPRSLFAWLRSGRRRRTPR